MTGTLAAIPTQKPRTERSARAAAKVALTSLILGTAFFAAGHDWNISLADAYTQDAEEMEITAEGGNTLRRLAFIGLAGWGLLLLATSRQPLAVEPFLAGSLGLLAGLAATSFLWADDPGMCLRRLLVLGCCLIAAIGISRALDMRQLCWLALLTLGGLALLGWEPFGRGPAIIGSREPSTPIHKGRRWLHSGSRHSGLRDNQAAGGGGCGACWPQPSCCCCSPNPEPRRRPSSCRLLPYNSFNFHCEVSSRWRWAERGSPA
jgi:hypothetical protein